MKNIMTACEARHAGFEYTGISCDPWDKNKLHVERKSDRFKKYKTAIVKNISDGLSRSCSQPPKGKISSYNLYVERLYYVDEYIDSSRRYLNAFDERKADLTKEYNEKVEQLLADQDKRSKNYEELIDERNKLIAEKEMVK